VIDIVQDMEIVLKKHYGYWHCFLYIIYREEIPDQQRGSRAMVKERTRI